MLWNLSPIMTEQNEVHVPNVNDAEHMSTWILFKFSEKTVKITKLWHKIANKNVLDLKNFCSMMVTTNEVLETCPE